MKGKKKYILVAIIVLITIGLFISLKMYNKPHVNIKTAKSEVIVTAQGLLESYQNDETLSNIHYANKLVEVTGEIHENTAENGNSIIALKDANGVASILCHMAPEENLKVLKLKKEGTITIKGICTGYLLDVILVRCILVSK